MTPFKDEVDRALNWVLSERGHGRIPYDFDSRSPIRLIGGYYVKRLTPTYNNIKNGTNYYLLIWYDKNNIEQQKRMNKPELIRWIESTHGTRPPIDATNGKIDYEWLSTPDIMRMFGVSDNTIRSYLNTREHPANTVMKVKGNKWRVARWYAVKIWDNHKQYSNGR